MMGYSHQLVSSHYSSHQAQTHAPQTIIMHSPLPSPKAGARAPMTPRPSEASWLACIRPTSAFVLMHACVRSMQAFVYACMHACIRCGPHANLRMLLLSNSLCRNQHLLQARGPCLSCKRNVLKHVRLADGCSLSLRTPLVRGCPVIRSYVYGASPPGHKFWQAHRIFGNTFLVSRNYSLVGS